MEGILRPNFDDWLAVFEFVVSVIALSEHRETVNELVLVREVLDGFRPPLDGFVAIGATGGSHDQGRHGESIAEEIL